MVDPFVHLRVASGYSMQYGANHPSALVARAAEHGMTHLGLTDRDGMYGSVRFAKACLAAGITPVIGVDLAVRFSPRHPASRLQRPPSAAKGGASDELWRAQQVGADRALGLPRVVVLARSRAGWARLCRLVSATHLAGERGAPTSSAELVGQYAADGELMVLLGPDSELGMAASADDRAGAEAELARWAGLVPSGRLVVAVSDLLVGGQQAGSARQAARLMRLADSHRLPVVLTNQVRMADRRGAMTCDVLDSARRLMALDWRAIDRRNAEGWLKPGSLLRPVAESISQAAGRLDGGAGLWAETIELGQACGLDPIADIGLGEVHLPEFEQFGTDRASAPAVLRAQCEAGLAQRYGVADERVRRRLDDELDVIGQLGFESYFLTVAEVVRMIGEMGIRCAARGSGAGSLVNYLLGISGVDPLAHRLIMERFLSPLRQGLPDIDLDVESERRTEIYAAVLQRFGGDRVSCVAMLETYRVRHAVRDVGRALSLPPAEIDAIAKSFPHIRARDARAALRDLPELRNAGLAEDRLAVLFELVESLDGLPRHVALHPCGVILSDAGLGDHTPVEASFGGFPMSQFDKDDVEDMGLLKLDILGIRMQSSIAHCLGEIDRTCGAGQVPDVDALAPFDDPGVYEMIGHAQTLGCFQIESPGQRELIGKFGPETFSDIIADISLFRPGPVKSDMVIPFLDARQGWRSPRYLHPSLAPILDQTCGVVVYHEQIIEIIAAVTGCSLAKGDEMRRALGDFDGQQQTRLWFLPRAILRGYPQRVAERIWDVLASFASFGFCKAHAAAFALPTYQSAWLKRYWPAHFIAGILTHDPGMYPKRLLVEEARRMGVQILGLDINASGAGYLVEPVPASGEFTPPPGLPDASGWGIRLSLADVKGMEAAAVVRICAGQPYASLTDFFTRAQVSVPVVENLIGVGAFDALYGIDITQTITGRDQVTRRDLLLRLADLKRLSQADARGARRAKGLRPVTDRSPLGGLAPDDEVAQAAARQAAGQVVAARVRQGFTGVQLALDFTEPQEADEGEWGADEWGAPCDRPRDVVASGLPEMTRADQLATELDVLGLDASQHIVEFYRDFLDACRIARSNTLLGRRNGSELLVAGVKVATQTPPVRSGRRVVFLTLDDGTGPVDATFFEDAQGPYAATVFSSWLLLVRGNLRRTGPRGVSLLATGAWDLQLLFDQWRGLCDTGLDAEQAAAIVLGQFDPAVPDSRPRRPPPPVDPLLADLAADEPATDQDAAARPPAGADRAPLGDPAVHAQAGGMGRRRVFLHASGFKQSPYADIRPAGAPADQAPRKLWHSSPGSSGR